MEGNNGFGNTFYFQREYYAGIISFHVRMDILAAKRDTAEGKCSSKTTDLNHGPTKIMNAKFNSLSRIWYPITENNLSRTLRNLRTISCEHMKALPTSK